MNIGDRIKNRRINLDLTADDLAVRVGKSRATIYRYENGDIENLPTTVIEPLAEALYTTPAYLMGWTDDPNDWESIGNESGIYPPKDYEGSYEDFVKFKINEVPEPFECRTTDIVRCETEDESKLILSYRDLSNDGKNKVVSYTNKLLDIEKDEEFLNAAHQRTDIDIQDGIDTSDDDIMDDENF